MQVAFCSLLLMAVVLTSRTLSNLRAIDPGFDEKHITTFTIDPGMRHYTSRQAWELRQRLLEGARSIPGVEAAGIAGRALMRGVGLVTSLRIPGQKTDQGFNTSVNVATPGYFDAMGMNFRYGRDFREGDADREPSPIVVNETFARRFFSQLDVVGRQVGVTAENRPQYEIVGVVGDAHYRSLRETPPPIFYLPFGPKSAANSFILQVRTNRTPQSIIQPIRDLLQSIDPGMPMYQIATLAEEIDRSLWQERLMVGLSAGFGLSALILSAVGVYGMLSHFVVRQQRELGIRLAIGAGRTDIVWLVFRRILLITGCGLVSGSVLYALSGKWLQAVLFGVRLFDGTAMALVIALTVIAALAGGFIPTIRALRIDPASTLRQE
jgi:predicted permease